MASANPLLYKLSVEIRCQIYKHVFADSELNLHVNDQKGSIPTSAHCHESPDDIDVDEDDEDEDEDAFHVSLDTKRFYSQLTSTCRQIRRESMPSRYANLWLNCFIGNDGQFPQPELYQIQCIIPPCVLRQIRYLRPNIRTREFFWPYNAMPMLEILVASVKPECGQPLFSLSVADCQGIRADPARLCDKIRGWEGCQIDWIDGDKFLKAANDPERRFKVLYESVVTLLDWTDGWQFRKPKDHHVVSFVRHPLL